MKGIPLDKWLHFVAGLIIAVLVSNLTDTPAYGLGAAVFAGVMKELRDWGCYLGFDSKDMLATWLGGVAGWIVAVLF